MTYRIAWPKSDSVGMASCNLRTLQSVIGDVVHAKGWAGAERRGRHRAHNVAMPGIRPIVLVKMLRMNGLGLGA